MSSETYTAAELAQNDPESRPMARIAQMLLWVAPNPDEAKIHITTAQQRIIIEIEVPPADRGNIIGRDGSIITAIRKIFLASLDSFDMIYDISLLDDDRGGRRTWPSKA